MDEKKKLGGLKGVVKGLGSAVESVGKAIEEIEMGLFSLTLLAVGTSPIWVPVVGVGYHLVDSRTRYIEPKPIERSADDLNQIEPYKADEAMKLFDEMAMKKCYSDCVSNLDALRSLTSEDKKKIQAEVADYMNRFEDNHHKLVKNYVKYYFDTNQKVPESIAKTMANKSGWNDQETFLYSSNTDCFNVNFKSFVSKHKT